MGLKDFFSKKGNTASAWDAEIEKDLNKVSLLTDIEVEKQRLTDVITEQVNKINYGGLIDEEKDVCRTRIETAYCCITALENAKKKVNNSDADSDLLEVVRNVAVTLNAVNKTSKAGVRLASKRFSRAMDIVDDNTDESNQGMQQIIPQIVHSNEVIQMADRIIRGESVSSCLKSEEGLGLESKISAVRKVKSFSAENAAISTEELQQRAQDFTRR